METAGESVHRSRYLPHAKRARYVQKCREWGKLRFWRNFAKVVGEMITANKLAQLEGPRNVGEFGESGEFSKVTILAKFR